jgi:hypothetical protein
VTQQLKAGEKKIMSSSSKLVVAAVAMAVVTAVAVVYLAAASTSKKKKLSTSNEVTVDDLDDGREAEGGAEGDDDETPRLAKAQLIKVFQQITAQMERVILRISQLEQQILQRAQQEEQEVDQNELRESMMAEFTNAMKDVEGRVYSSLNVTEAEVEQATNYFNDDADFQAVLKTLRRKYALFTGQGVEDVPDFVTMELIMDVMSETMQKMTAAMEEVFHQTKGEMSVGTEQFAQTLQQRYVEKIGVLRQKVQKKYNIDQDLLQAGVIKYQNNPEFQRKMVELTTEQSEAYKKLGLA